MLRRPRPWLALLCVVALAAGSAACTDLGDDTAATTTTEGITFDDEGTGTTPATEPPPSSLAPGQLPDFCTAYDGFGRYAASLPLDTIEQMRQSTVLVADAVQVLLDVAPEEIVPQITLLKEQADAIAASTEAAASVEEANAAASEITAEGRFRQAGVEARDFYESTCPAPEGG